MKIPTEERDILLAVINGDMTELTAAEMLQIKLEELGFRLQRFQRFMASDVS
jgi:hypothetical protein